MESINREQAFNLLKQYNKEYFHIQHALTVEGVMRWYAVFLGYSESEDLWAISGLLHDIDYEMFPDQHCIKAMDILQNANIDEKIIHAVCSHGYGITVDIKPESDMEKVLFATDELTGLIGAYALMRPSKSTKGMELAKLKKKFKDKKFAAGCSRDIIIKGANMLNWDIDTLLERTILAMEYCEDNIKEQLNNNILK